MNRIKHSLGALAAMTLVVAAAWVLPAYGTGGGGGETEPCVPKDAWTEVIEHPAETHVVHHEATYATEYHFAKFTRTKTRTYTEGTPAVKEVWANFAPNDKKGKYVGPPTWPTDPDGKWIIHDSIPGGHAGPDGVYQKGSGNSSWFYRQAGKAAVPGTWGPWSEYGPWTKWSPETHTSWEDSDTPLGSPAFHAQWKEGNTEFYRQWQAQHDGQTRQGEMLTEAYDETVIDKEAWTETIEHPAVVCETETPTPTPTETTTETPTETPSETPSETPTVTPTPEVPTPEVPTPEVPTPTVPTEEPEPSETPTPQPPKETPQPPKDTQVIQCVNGTWQTTVNGEVIAESGTCEQNLTPTATPVPAQEEGL